MYLLVWIGKIKSWFLPLLSDVLQKSSNFDTAGSRWRTVHLAKKKLFQSEDLKNRFHPEERLFHPEEKLQ